DPRQYMRIAAEIRQGLAEGRWRPGQPVPSITTLSQEYGVARQTAAKALRLLEDEGLLARRPGLGYYVRWPCAHGREAAPGLNGGYTPATRERHGAFPA